MPDTKTQSEQIGFATVVNGSFRIFWQIKKHLAKVFFITVGLLLLVTIVLGLIGFTVHSLIVLPILLTVGWVAFMIIGMMYYGAIERQAFIAINEGPIETVWTSCVNALKLFWRAIYLSLKIFVYSGIWIVFLALIGFAVAATVLSAGNYGDANLIATKVRSINVTQAADSGGPAIGASDQTKTISGATGGQNSVQPSNGFISSGESEGLIAPTSEAKTSYRQMTLTLINYSLGALGLIAIIAAMIRLVWASLAFPFLFGTPGISAKEALDTSVMATKGKWWLVVLYSIGFSMLLAVLTNLMSFTGVAFGRTLVGLILLVPMIIATVAAAMLQLVFKQFLAVELKTRGDQYKLW